MCLCSLYTLYRHAYALIIIAMCYTEVFTLMHVCLCVCPVRRRLLLHFAVYTFSAEILAIIILYLQVHGCGAKNSKSTVLNILRARFQYVCIACVRACEYAAWRLHLIDANVSVNTFEYLCMCLFIYFFKYKLDDMVLAM